MGLHRGRWLLGNKRFFTCGTLETSEKSLDPCSKDSHSLIGYPYYKDSPLRDHGNQNCNILTSLNKGIIAIKDVKIMQQRHSSYFFISNLPWVVLKQHFNKLLERILFRMFSSQCHNSLVLAARQIANNLSQIAKKIYLFLPDA